MYFLSVCCYLPVRVHPRGEMHPDQIPTTEMKSDSWRGAISETWEVPGKPFHRSPVCRWKDMIWDLLFKPLPWAGFCVGRNQVNERGPQKSPGCIVLTRGWSQHSEAIWLLPTCLALGLGKRAVTKAAGWKENPSFVVFLHAERIHRHHFFWQRSVV